MAEPPPVMPPPEYLHPSSVPMIEHVMSAEQVDRYCREIMPTPVDYHYRGCLQRMHGGRVCLVYRIDSDDVRQHQLAHCNGWPADHPGATSDWRFLLPGNGEAIATARERIVEVLAKYDVKLEAAPLDALAIAMDRLIDNARGSLLRPATNAPPLSDGPVE